MNHIETFENNETLAKMIEDINSKIIEAEKFARENNLVFSVDFGYGGRAEYRSTEKISVLDNFSIPYDIHGELAYGWLTSIHDCL